MMRDFFILYEYYHEREGLRLKSDIDYKLCFIYLILV